MNEAQIGQAGGTGAPMRLIARIVMVVAALGLVAAFFLPWASAGEDYREAAELAPDVMFYEPTGLTVEGATDLSLFEYTQVYGSMSGTGWEIYQYIMYAALGVAAITLVLAALGKPVGAAVFGILTLAASRLLVWDFEDRGVLPNGTHDWGIAPVIYLVAAVVLIAAAVWMLVLKRQAKAAARGAEQMNGSAH